MIFTNNISPILFSVGGLQVHWYGLFFALGIVFAYVFLMKAFRKHGYPVEHVDSLAIYLFLGLLIGARLGEVFFYEPAYYFAHPVDILKVWNGGLASHGATIGLFVAYFIWLKVHKIKFTKYADLLVIPIPVTAACVRIGNFFNSEIIGKPTDGGWGVVFKKLGETFPRHPSQLYEAVLLLGTFAVLFWLYKKYFGRVKPLFFLFLFFLLYFGGRFLLEYFKDLHGPLPTGFPLSMGQVLSAVPVVVAVAWFAWFYRKKA
ncbi:prolipoprotein diacylglyceryl transferase [Candidatus Peregrinibacteria bacterium]|nr:prolipoprotein diacylglyceryl transferase [Candidatus Peregrinibacteria bacterium]